MDDRDGWGVDKFGALLVLVFWLFVLGVALALLMKSFGVW